MGARRPVTASNAAAHAAAAVGLALPAAAVRSAFATAVGIAVATIAVVRGHEGSDMVLEEASEVPQARHRPKVRRVVRPLRPRRLRVELARGKLLVR